MASYRQPFKQGSAVGRILQRKRCRSTVRQLEEMVLLMLQNQDLAVGRTSGPMVQEKNDRTWEEIAAKISAFGPRKTGIQCKTTWRDLKLKVKAKNASIKKSRLSNENGTEAVPKLTDLDKKILLIIGTESSEGIGVEESGLEGQELSKKPIHFVDVMKSVPTLEESKPILQQLHRNPQRQTAKYVQQDSADSRNGHFAEMDDVANQYAELQANTNTILADIAIMLREAVNDKKKADLERNNLMKERNDIEREKLKFEKKKLRSNMMLKQHVFEDSD